MRESVQHFEVLQSCRFADIFPPRLLSNGMIFSPDYFMPIPGYNNSPVIRK